MAIKDYSQTPASNTLNPEGMAAAAVNNNMRQMQADIRVDYDDPEYRDRGHTPVFVSWTAGTKTLVMKIEGVDVTSYYLKNMLFSIDWNSTTYYGYISTNATFSTDTTVTGIINTTDVLANPVSNLKTYFVDPNKACPFPTYPLLAGETGVTNLEYNYGDIRRFGAVLDGINDDGPALSNAFTNQVKKIYIPDGILGVSTLISKTQTEDLEIYGEGVIKYIGSQSTDNILTIITAGYNLSINGLKFDGDNLIAGGCRIEQRNAMDNDTIPYCIIKNCTFIDFRMNTASIWNQACYIAGGFERVVFENNNIRNITRAAGTGTPGSTGTSGLTCTWYSSSIFVRKLIHTGNTYNNITGDDALGSSNNVDYDAVKFFSPNPTNFPNDDSSVYNYAPSAIMSENNTYINCRGRGLKIQAKGFVRRELFIRNSGYNNHTSSPSVEISFQYGIGHVSDIDVQYNDYDSGGTTSPIQNSMSIVSFYQGSWYNETSGGITVENINIFNGIKAGVGADIQTVVQLLNGTTPSTKDRPLMAVRNITMNRGSLDWIVTTSFAAGANGLLKMSDIVVDKLNYSAVGTNTANTDIDIIATGIIHMDAVKTPANKVPFVTDITTPGGNVSWAGIVSGWGNQGFNHSYANGADYNYGPMLHDGAIASSSGSLGGAITVQSVQLADDASHVFDQRFYGVGEGLVLVTTNHTYTTQGVLSIGSQDIYVLAAHGSHLFDASTTGANPDTDTKLNLWIDGSNLLNIKNRLGATYVITVAFIG